MALSLEGKKAVVAEVAEVARNAHSAIAAEYRGLTVSQITGLRAKARQSGVYLRVVKNTLARRAVAGTEFECISGNLRGPLILAFSTGDPGSAARVVREFARDNDKLVPTLVSIGGQLLSAAELDESLKSATDDTFNAITVDGDTSTNDMILLMANGAAKNHRAGARARQQA